MMKSLFWVAFNFIGFVILISMYTHKDKNLTGNSYRTAAQRSFGYLLISIMLFLLFDTGMFLLDGTVFRGARLLNYVFSMLFYIVCPLPGIFYLLYCDNKIIKNQRNLRLRIVFYLIPVVINTIAVLLTPLTQFIFSIDDNNIYSRGSYFWVSLVITFIYVFSVYPVLAVHLKREKGSIFKKENDFLYLFPLPSVILTIVQIMNYGLLLIGFGLVLSSFLIYINSIQSVQDRRSLAMRFYNLNIIQFAVISSVMMAGMFWILEDATDKISKDYAAYNSVGAANILETYLNKEIGVLGTIARSKALIEWIEDESNEEKKRTAYDELINTLGVLYNNNVYIVVGQSGREYTLDKDTRYDDFRSHAAISQNNPKDKWVFDLMAQEHEYNLNVDVDKELYRKRVWLNFKITSGKDSVGIICTGMDLSDITMQVMLLQRDRSKSRTFIIDEKGNINIDSELIEDDDDFLLYGVSKKISREITDPGLLSALQTYLNNIDGYFSELHKEAEVISLQKGRYRYATITPIGTTSWSLVTLYDSSSLFGISNLLPVLLIIAAMLIIFTYSSNTITTRLIFLPLKQLINSLINMRKNNEQKIYGSDRNDEIGLLSNAIQDYFVKGYYDELTGIFNRRYFETTFHQILVTLSRAKYKLSVMMLDIDFFKKYNDTYGHGEGDVCLRKIAEALNKEIARKGDFIARYGGEEFAVVLPYTDEEGAKTLAESMLQAVRDLQIPHEKNEGGIVTISIGLTTNVNNDIQNREDYLKKADEALYLSKKNGRNRATFIALI